MSIFRDKPTRQIVRNSQTPTTITIQEDGTNFANDVAIINLTGDGVAISETDGIVTATITGTSIGSVALEDLNNVTITGVVDNQVLTYENGEWINKNPQGGNTPTPSEKVTLGASPAFIVLAVTGTTTITLTPAISTGFTIDSVTYDVRDQDGHPITTTTPAADFTTTFVADDTMRGQLIAIVHVSYTKDSDSTTGIDSHSTTIPVRERWYSQLSATQPTDVASMTQETGVWSSPKDMTFTQDNTGRNLYIALPTDDAPYRFHSGSGFDVTYADTDLGSISTNWTLYSVDDYDDSQTSGSAFPLVITEV